MRKEVRHHDGLARLAGEQHGVVGHQQLLELGYSQTAIGRGVESRRLHRIHRGAYAVGNPKPSNHGRCLAAVLACGRDAMLSHDSAAWLWGLRSRCPSRTEVTLPARGHRRRGIHIHHSTILESVDRAIREGIPTTSVARTLLDCRKSAAPDDRRASRASRAPGPSQHPRNRRDPRPQRASCRQVEAEEIHRPVPRACLFSSRHRTAIPGRGAERRAPEAGDQHLRRRS
jgi:hypothetical protein